MFLLRLGALLSAALCAAFGCVATPNGAAPATLSRAVSAGERFMGVRLLGALRLPGDAVDGQPLRGLSALAWDDDEQLLYALSDRGGVFHLRPVIDDGLLVDVAAVAAYPLRDSRGAALVPPWRDSEGLTLYRAANGVRGDSELVVSFEVKQRLRRYTPRGRRLGEIALPPALRDAGAFHNPNRSLEALTIHPRWGLLVAPERPLRGRRADSIDIYREHGSSWRYPLAPARGSALVAIEALPDGSLLTLERAFVSLARPLVISLRRAWMDQPPGGVLRVDDVAVFDTSKGWLLDNFEGLTAHGYGRFFIVSDDNASFLQNTLLAYFELVDAPAAAGRRARPDNASPRP